MVERKLSMKRKIKKIPLLKLHLNKSLSLFVVKMKKIFCQNCGLNNHKKKDCPFPIISIGIICAKIEKSIKLKPIQDHLKIERVNLDNLKGLTKINKYKNKIKFLLIRRKHTINFVEFVRGKYKIDETELKELFRLMSPDEIILIGTLDFKNLWKYLWKDTSWRKSFEKEFQSSYILFDKFKNTKLFKYLTSEFIPDYNEPEWGFPKGRRDFLEDNITCALREFNEETGLDSSTVDILDNVSPIYEEYLGTNNKTYRHILYLGQYNKVKTNFNIKNNLEVGEIGWFTLDEILNLLRDYHHERIKVIEKAYLFLVNLII